MGIKPSAEIPGEDSGAILGNDQIGQVYADIRLVAQNIDVIVDVSENLENVSGLVSTAVTKATEASTSANEAEASATAAADSAVAAANSATAASVSKDAAAVSATNADTSAIAAAGSATNAAGSVVAAGDQATLAQTARIAAEAARDEAQEIVGAEYVTVASVGQPNGVMPLDSSGKASISYLPAIALTDVYVVASQAAQLALVAEEGDVAIRTDLDNQAFIHNGGVAGTMADWTGMTAPSTGAAMLVGGNAFSGDQTISGSFKVNGSFTLAYGADATLFSVSQDAAANYFNSQKIEPGVGYVDASTIFTGSDYIFKIGGAAKFTVGSAGSTVTGTLSVSGAATAGSLKVMNDTINRSDGNAIIYAAVGGSTGFYSNSNGAYVFGNSVNSTIITFDGNNGLYTFTGNLIARRTTAADVNIILDAIDGQYRTLNFKAGGIDQYAFGTDSSGGFNISRYSYAGVWAGNLISFGRTTATITLRGDTNIEGTFAFTWGGVAVALVTDLASKADARPTITAISASRSASDSDNNTHLVASGAGQTLTLGSLSAGTSFTGRFTTAWSLAVPGGLSKNGAAPAGVTTGSIAANKLITFLHEGAGVWVVSGDGLT